MKKTLSIIMALCMILSICSFSVSAAPAGTAITSEADFLAMKEDGAYYLANDITVTKSYDKLFTGVFDGNGKTVTVSEPMFLEFCGSAMNLTIKGEIVADHAKDNGYWARGAFACMASGDGTVLLYNIVNNANVTGFTTQDTATYAGLLGNAYTGGILGALDNKSVGTSASIAIIECENNGNVKGFHCTGGITGILYVNDSEYLGEQTATVTNCVNNGNVEGLSTYTGGMVGRVYYVVDANFSGCINNGEIKGAGNTGGIIGHTTNTSLIMRVCQNNGSISNLVVEGGTPYAGGLVGYAQGTKSDKFAAIDGKYANQVEFCINTGTITGSCRSGGILGSTGADGAYGLSHTRYCINTGNVTNNGLGASAAANAAGGIQGYGYGSGDKEYAYVTDCITTGNIEALNPELGIAAYFLGYISSNNAMMARNSATGSIYAPSGRTYALGWNNKGTYTEATVGNNLLATNIHKLAYENGVDSEKTFDCGITDETALINGKAIADFNAAYKSITGATSDAMTQTLDGTFKPQIVVLKAEAPEVVIPETEPETEPVTEPATEPVTEPVTEPATEPTTEAVETPAPQVTEAPQTEPAPAKSGCGAAISGGAIVAILCMGVAMIAKKKEN